jgi:hypothetical protein
MRKIVMIILVGSLPACFSSASAHHAVISTAAIAETPWTCGESKTQVVEVADAKYRLTGCGQTSLYNCNFAFQPPRCWR